MSSTERALGANAVVGVVGAGSMGAGIAQLAAQSGHEVRLFDSQPGAAERGLARIDADLDAGVQRGRLDAAERAVVRGRISVASDLAGLAGCSLVVEAIIEKLDAKRSLFAQLEQICAPQAVLATNTSSISISAIAQGLERPERVIGWHFFNPVTRMKLVEIIPGVETGDEWVKALHALSRAWGKTSVDAPNAPGFIVNRVARPYYAEALRLLAERIATPEAIDRLLREAGGFAMGPFELIDLIGADVNLSVTESVFAATAWDSRYAPHIIQQELVRAGRFGRKSGRGFYDYAKGAKAPVAAKVTAAAAEPAAGRAVQGGGLLQALAERVHAGAGVSAAPGSLQGDSLQLGDQRYALTDGRTLAERRFAASAGEAPDALVDLARDYASTPVIGATGPAAALQALAAALAPAGIDVIALGDVAGLVVMREIACIVNEAADLMTWSGTTGADIDTSMRLGMAYTQGPLAWADAVGPQRLVAVLAHLQAHYGDARYRRSPRLSAARYAGESFNG